MVQGECFSIAKLITGTTLSSLSVLTPALCNYHCSKIDDCSAWSYIYTEFTEFAIPPLCRLFVGDVTFEDMDLSLHNNVMAVSGYPATVECPLDMTRGIGDPDECEGYDLPLVFGPYARAHYRPGATISTVAKFWGSPATYNCILCDIGAGFNACGQESIDNPVPITRVLDWQNTWDGGILNYVIQPVVNELSWNCASNQYSLKNAVTIRILWAPSTSHCQRECVMESACVVYSSRESEYNTGVLCTLYREYDGIVANVSKQIFWGFRNCLPSVDAGTAISYFQAMVDSFGDSKTGKLSSEKLKKYQLLSKGDQRAPLFRVSLLGIRTDPSVTVPMPMVVEGSSLFCRDPTTYRWDSTECDMQCIDDDGELVVGFAYEYSVGKVPFIGAVTPWIMNVTGACDPNLFLEI